MKSFLLILCLLPGLQSLAQMDAYLVNQEYYEKHKVKTVRILVEDHWGNEVVTAIFEYAPEAGVLYISHPPTYQGGDTIRTAIEFAGDHKFYHHGSHSFRRGVGMLKEHVLYGAYHIELNKYRKHFPKKNEEGQVVRDSVVDYSYTGSVDRIILYQLEWKGEVLRSVERMKCDPESGTKSNWDRDTFEWDESGKILKRGKWDLRDADPKGGETVYFFNENGLLVKYVHDQFHMQEVRRFEYEHYE